MPASPHKCKLCGHEHWNSELHVFADDPKPVTKPVTVAPGVTSKTEKPVTQTEKPVTVAEKPVTVAQAPEQPVTPSGTPVVRGKRGPARVYASNAERQRAYRARRQAGA